MTGARYVGSMNANQEQVLREYAVANSVTVTKGDFVYFSSGRITSASIAGVRLLGVAQSTVTGNSGGTNKVLVDVTPLGLYLIDNDNVGTTFAASHVGTYFDLIGATGAQQVDTSTTSSSSGQLVAMEFDPSYVSAGADSDNSVGVFCMAERALYLG